MQAFIATAQIWVSDTQTIPIPVLGVFPDADTAIKNAYVVLARAITEDQPHLLEHPVTVTATPVSDEMLREFLANVNRYRPDILRPPRGKAR